MIIQNPPPAQMPEGTVIVNMQTGNAKILGVSGDVQINLSNNTVSYKAIEKAKFPVRNLKILNVLLVIPINMDSSQRGRQKHKRFHK